MRRVHAELQGRHETLSRQHETLSRQHGVALSEIEHLKADLARMRMRVDQLEEAAARSSSEET